MHFKRLHYLVSQQLLARVLRYLSGFFLAGGFNLQGNMLTNTYILYLAQAQIFEATHYRLSLRI